jgi:uncharacterized protein
MRPAIPWVLPFAVFMTLLVLSPHLGLPPRADLTLRLAVPAIVLLLVSRRVLSLECAAPLLSAATGVAVFILWVGPDLLFPGYRAHWLLSNPLTGATQITFDAASRDDLFAIVLRVSRAAILVPVVEELFWRGWMMRWLANPDFESVPLGHYERRAFWVTAILFALEHGPYWDVGLAAGAVYNGLMVRTRRIGDLILSHAVTNACLAAYVLKTGRWEFWQ